jgi:hypothetical protein
MQGPLTGAVLMLELTRHFDALMVPMLVAVVEATIVSRRLGAHSIYSARLAEDPSVEVNPAAGAAAIATLYALDDRLPADLTRPPRGGWFGTGGPPPRRPTPPGPASSGLTPTGPTPTETSPDPAPPGPASPGQTPPDSAAP